jgi:uncharacterized protein YdhG (YjbR/CyaY superfamily)
MYGASGAIEEFKEELSPYAGEKGSLRFPFDKPMPLALIRDIVRFRVKVNLADVPKGKTGTDDRYVSSR